uniref:Reverse transcriptase domain-containing protein n=2 Tax=Nicotiana TaxID=4085 RepID=A0A1S3ZRA2_TOBAC|nr:PREDICTED: uncharacterized protein LOC104210521 isoform X2 [Nicotiana sylvestris]XP_016467055.1 PREDICTED: uncharacterized protein LOC107789716 [Nicotiana tabacum]
MSVKYSETYVAWTLRKCGRIRVGSSKSSAFLKDPTRVRLQFGESAQHSLKHMNFGDKWIEWINYCISTVRCSILINGNPRGFFKSHRGLRQGDPLSPCLFTLVMEAFSMMLKRAENLGWIKGMSFGRIGAEKVTLSHILYADDTLLLCETDNEQMLFLRGIFSIFSINVDDCIEELADILGCKVENFPTIYLGFPLGARRNDQSIWQGVLDRCANKLIPWKKQYLSFGGRLTLINSVLDDCLPKEFE